MDNKQRSELIDAYRDAVSQRVAFNSPEHHAAETAAREALLGHSQAVNVVQATEAIVDRLATIMTWLREPDWTQEASLEWLMDWMNRRPIAELAMVAMLMPVPPSPQVTAAEECLPPPCQFCGARVFAPCDTQSKVDRCELPPHTTHVGGTL